MQLVLHRGDDIGLTPEQQQAIRDQQQKTQEECAAAASELAAQTDALSQLISQDKPDVQKALEQLDKVLDAERIIKRAQVANALAISALLTDEQRTKLRQITERMAAAGPPPQQLRMKFEQAMTTMHKAQEAGQDVGDIHKVVTEAQRLQDDGQFKQAEDKVDEALKRLGENEKEQK
jgi:Spy/CpxP family protein refolding chaperone